MTGHAVTREFCPDGYLRAKEALERAARYWFPEQIAAFNSAVAGESAISHPPKNVALTPVEELADALRPPPSMSDALRQQIMHLLTEVEHRVRNFLHQGALTAYHFGGLFDQGRHAIAREFWATSEAEGVLISGSFWPFGKPRAWHEQRPGYSLCFVESQLEKLLSENSK